MEFQKEYNQGMGSSPCERSIVCPLCWKVTVRGGRLVGGLHGIIAVFPWVTLTSSSSIPASKLPRSAKKIGFLSLTIAYFLVGHQYMTVWTTNRPHRAFMFLMRLIYYAKCCLAFWGARNFKYVHLINLGRTAFTKDFEVQTKVVKRRRRFAKLEQRCRLNNLTLVSAKWTSSPETIPYPALRYPSWNICAKYFAKL